MPRLHGLKDGASYCYCAYVLRISGYSGFLKWYYDEKITFIFSLDFETLFTKHSPAEI